MTAECPGVSEYGHGLTLTTIHMRGCCEKWAQAAPQPEPAQPEAEREPEASL
jgi:hypothetical protein